MDMRETVRGAHVSAAADGRPPRTPEDLAAALEAERPRLVRLCARLSGERSPEVAEDLAQETLYEAWRNADRLLAARAWNSYLSGIAQHVCLRRRRAWAREIDAGVGVGAGGAVVGMPAPLPSWRDVVLAAGAPPEPTPGDDLGAVLERTELRDLLDRAMALLPAETRDLLFEEYVEDTPQAEIAARRGWTENNAAVRLHRSRAALKRVVLEAPELKETAAAHGLLADDEIAGWQETRLWCPNCGKARLEARFERDAGEAGEDGGEAQSFAVRCPSCRELLGYDFTTLHAAIDARRLLGGVKGFKPALNRLNEWWGALGERAACRREIPCASCGRPGARVSFGDAPAGTHPELTRMPGMFVACERCRRVHCLSPNGSAFHSAVGREFYKRHPRMRLLPWREVDCAGRRAVLVTMEGRGTDSARLEAVYARDTYELLRLSGGAA
jgi:RNA polymerase sigma factor (sigma-70 family)